MATKSKAQQVKFEVGQLVEFNNRFGRVSKVAKNGAVSVIVLGETTVLNETREELRVKKADLHPVVDVSVDVTGTGAEWAVHYSNACMRKNIAVNVTAHVQQSESGNYVLAPEYIPSLGCLKMLDWEGRKDDESTKKNWGIDLIALAAWHADKKTQDTPERIQEIEAIAQLVEAPEALTQESEALGNANRAKDDVKEEKEVSDPSPVQLTLVESDPQANQAASRASHTDNGVLPTPLEFSDAAYILRELTFSAVRHSILTAFMDMVNHKDKKNYHQEVSGNLRNLITAAFDPVADVSGHIRINTWMLAALELVINNKERVHKLLSQPIEASPVKLDKVSKLGLWIDHQMNKKKGSKASDSIAAIDCSSHADSCYLYHAESRKLEIAMFVPVDMFEGALKGDELVQFWQATPGRVEPFTAYLTVQAAVQERKAYIDSFVSPTTMQVQRMYRYTGIIPVFPRDGISTEQLIDEVIKEVFNM